MAGEVLGRSPHVMCLQAVDLGDAKFADQCGVFTHGTDSDDRVVRVGVEVQYRGEVHVDAHGAHLRPQDSALGPCKLLISGGTQCHVAREYSGGRPDPGHKATFLVDGHGQRDAFSVCAHGRFLQAVRKARNLPGVGRVAGPSEVEDAAQVVLLHHLGWRIDAVPLLVA
ncbi:hypothetical protein PJL18_03720 [Paenarthrobacter nicotinovorans]|nr:hypothetical protein [Paenarthrobacter nicotinovorans]